MQQPSRMLHRQPPQQSSAALPTSNLLYTSHHLHQRQSAQQQQPAVVAAAAAAAAVGGGRWDSGMQECAGCGCIISERYLLRALDRYWHEDCLKCSCCDCRLGEVGSTLFTKANLLLCRRDYLRYTRLCLMPRVHQDTCCRIRVVSTCRCRRVSCVGDKIVDSLLLEIGYKSTLT